MNLETEYNYCSVITDNVCRDSFMLTLNNYATYACWCRTKIFPCNYKIPLEKFQLLISLIFSILRLGISDRNFVLLFHVYRLCTD